MSSKDAFRTCNDSLIVEVEMEEGTIETKGYVRGARCPTRVVAQNNLGQQTHSFSLLR